MVALVHLAFVGTLVGILVIRTGVELINLWHTRRCVEDGYPGVEAFDIEEKRFKSTVSDAITRTVYRLVVVGVAIGFVYLGPFDLLVTRAGSSMYWWAGVALGLVTLTTVVKSVVRTVDHSITYPRLDLAAPLQWRIKHEFNQTVLDVVGGGLAVLVVFGSAARWPTRWPIAFVLFLVIVNVTVNGVIPFYRRLRWQDEIDSVPSENYERVLSAFEVACPVVELESTDEHVTESSQLAGIGPTKTVFVRESRGNAMEFRTSLAHEMGHAEHRHIELSVLYEVVELGALAGLAAYLTSAPWFSAAFQLPQSATGGALLVALIWVVAIGNHLDPIDNLISHRMEDTADSYTYDWGANTWADSLRDHYMETASNPYTHRLHAVYHDSHPPVVERIRRARDS